MSTPFWRIRLIKWIISNQTKSLVSRTSPICCRHSLRIGTTLSSAAWMDKTLKRQEYDAVGCTSCLTYFIAYHFQYTLAGNEFMHNNKYLPELDPKNLVLFTYEIASQSIMGTGLWMTRKIRNMGKHENCFVWHMQENYASSVQQKTPSICLYLDILK